VAGNTVWSHMACEFPVAVKSEVDDKLAVFTFTFYLGTGAMSPNCKD